MRNDEIYSLNAEEPSGGYGAYVPGLILIFFGVLVLVVPRLLEMLVATFFIILGVMALGFGHKLRQSRKWSRRFFMNMFDDDFE